jgi:hypothetical protein
VNSSSDDFGWAKGSKIAQIYTDPLPLWPNVAETLPQVQLEMLNTLEVTELKSNDPLYLYTKSKSGKTTNLGVDNMRRTLSTCAPTPFGRAKRGLSNDV